jgi:glycosyltransferase involved in cell wall biosynthesis
MVQRVRPSGAGRLGKYLMVPALLIELLRLQRRYDVIYLFGLRVLGPACVAAAHLTGKPCVLRADVSGEVSAAFIWDRVGRTAPPLQWILRGLVAARDAAIRRADRLVSISGEICQEYLDAGVDPAKVERIPNGIDVERFTPANDALRAALRSRFSWDWQTIFLFAGRLQTGRLVDVDDDDGLYRAMKEVVARSDDTKRMADAGRAVVHDRYSIDASAARHAALFERVRQSQRG